MLSEGIIFVSTFDKILQEKRKEKPLHVISKSLKSQLEKK